MIREALGKCRVFRLKQALGGLAQAACQRRAQRFPHPARLTAGVHDALQPELCGLGQAPVGVGDLAQLAGQAELAKARFFRPDGAGRPLD